MNRIDAILRAFLSPLSLLQPHDCIKFTPMEPEDSEKDRNAQMGILIMRAHQEMYGTIPDPYKVADAIRLLGHKLP